MNIVSLIFFFAAIVALYLGIYALILDPKSKVNRSFLYLAICSATWLFTSVFLQSSSTEKEAWFWYRLSSLGWANIAGLYLYHVLCLTKNNLLSRYKVLHILLFVPGIIFTYLCFTAIIFSSGFTITGSYVYEKPPEDKFPAIIFLVYTTGFLLFALFLIFRWNRITKIQREKRQAWIYLITVPLTIIMTYIFNVLFHLTGGTPLPQVGHIFLLTWLLGAWYAMVRYNLMVLTPDFAVDEIISKMNDLLILVNTEGKIIKVNSMVNKLLDYKESEVMGRVGVEFVLEKELVKKIYIEEMKNISTSNTVEINLVKKDRSLIPVNMSYSKIDEKTGDPLGFVLIAHDITQVKELAKERNKLKIRNETIEKELIMAREIQMQFIPSGSPHSKISFYYKPMDQVGGDFFEFTTFRESKLIGIFLSDVSGHGVPAAFITSLIKSFTLQPGNSRENPADFLRKLNNFLLNHTGGNFVTALYGIYDLSSREFIYSSAGHNLPYMISTNKIEQLSAKNKTVPLAIFSNEEIEDVKKPFYNNSIILEENSKLLLYTDGLVEAVNINDAGIDFEKNCFEKKSLRHLMKDNQDLPSDQFVNKIVTELIAFRGSETFEDDVCIICLDT
ncbi:MAG: SpoIIE family protein phosphatase [bacterium]|nr:SpoIIE family protein phosphatase [bacterium]